jgi:hypothetical protein
MLEPMFLLYTTEKIGSIPDDAPPAIMLIVPVGAMVVTVEFLRGL